MAITTQILSTAGVKTALGIAKEAVLGTPVAPSVYLPFTSSTLTAENKLITRQAIRKSKGMPPPGSGSLDVKGDITIEADADSCGFLLANGMGVDTVTTGASGNYIHTMILAQGLNSLTLSQDNAVGSVLQYVGCKIDKLDISCKPDSYLEIKASVIGTNLIPSFSPGYLTPTYSSKLPFEFDNLGVAAGGVSLLNSVSQYITDFTISLSNGLKAHFASPGGRFAVGVDETIAMVTGTMTINMYDDSINKLLWGSSTAPTAGAVSQVPLTFTFTQAASGGVTPSISFTLPAITIQSCTVSPKRNDVLVQSIKFNANESTFLAQNDLQIILTNGNSIAYAP